MSAEDEMNESPTPESSDSDQQQPSNSSAPRKKKASKPRLTATQKNTNHKDAENKRRNAIRERFVEMSAMVPGTKGQERSEQVMLQKTAEFLKRQIRELRQLEAMADIKGLPVEESERLKVNDYGGREWKQPHMDEYRMLKAKKEMNGVMTAKEDEDEG